MLIRTLITKLISTKDYIILEIKSFFKFIKHKYISNDSLMYILSKKSMLFKVFL